MPSSIARLFRRFRPRVISCLAHEVLLVLGGLLLASGTVILIWPDPASGGTHLDGGHLLSGGGGLLLLLSLAAAKMQTFTEGERTLHRPSHDEGGRVEGVVAADSDVSARVEAEEALRGRESELRSLLQQVPAAVWTTDRNLEITSLRGGIAERNPVLLAALTDSVEHGLDRRSIAAHLQALEGEVAAYEITLDGRTYRCRVEPYRDAEGELVGVVGVALDVTDVKNAEAERRELDQQLRHAQKMEAVGRLAGGIAHDFNNLLTIIDGNAESVVEMLADAPEELLEIRQAVSAAASLTRQLLAFTRQQHFQPSVFELDDAVAEAISLLKLTLGEQVGLVHLAGSDGARIEADRPQIQQVLLNLAINARDAMPRGGKLEIRTDRRHLDLPVPADEIEAEHAGPAGEELAAGDYVRIRVSDDGVGMDQTTLERAFEPFFSTKRSDIGTGLGLATVHGIVRQSGGSVSAESRRGFGTTLTILLPLTTKQLTRPPAGDEAARSPARSARLLLVEDEAGVRRMLARGLRRLGYEVLEAADGKEAVRLAQSSGAPPDLVVTDVLMPDMTGPELAERLRGLDPAPRLLFISGYTRDELRGGLEEADYLQKPFTVQTLALRLETMLGPRATAAPLVSRPTT